MKAAVQRSTFDMHEAEKQGYLKDHSRDVIQHVQPYYKGLSVVSTLSKLNPSQDVNDA